jgi:hypothetical protein
MQDDEREKNGICPDESILSFDQRSRSRGRLWPSLYPASCVTLILLTSFLVPRTTPADHESNMEMRRNGWASLGVIVERGVRTDDKSWLAGKCGAGK